MENTEQLGKINVFIPGYGYDYDDNYTLGYSDAQRYKMIGNGWTVDVVAHLLKGLHESRT